MRQLGAIALHGSGPKLTHGAQARAALARQPGLRQNIVNHIPRHVRQPEVAATIPVRESRVIDAQGMQQGGAQIVDMHRVLDRLEAKLVSVPVSDSTTAPEGAPSH